MCLLLVILLLLLFYFFRFGVATCKGVFVLFCFGSEIVSVPVSFFDGFFSFLFFLGFQLSTHRRKERGSEGEERERERKLFSLRAGYCFRNFVCFGFFFVIELKNRGSERRPFQL